MPQWIGTTTRWAQARDGLRRARRIEVAGAEARSCPRSGRARRRAGRGRPSRRRDPCRLRSTPTQSPRRRTRRAPRSRRRARGPSRARPGRRGPRARRCARCRPSRPRRCSRSAAFAAPSEAPRQRRPGPSCRASRARGDRGGRSGHGRRGRHRSRAAPGLHWDRTPQVRDAVPQQRVGEKANAVEVDDGRRVPDVLDPHRAKARSR